MTPGPELRRSFVQLLHRDLELMAYFEAADRMLERWVSFDASCWLSLDPATLLPTSHFSRQYDLDDLSKMAANEFLEDDFSKFADIARADRPVSILSEATGGATNRSRRHETFLVPNGFADGDELRAVLRDGEVAWGAIAIHRRRAPFVPVDAVIIAHVGPLLAHGVRRAMLRSALRNEGQSDAPGLVLLRGDDTIEAITPPARDFMDELFDTTAAWSVTPLTVLSVAQLARRAGRGTTNDLAVARLPRRSGGWIRMDATLLDDGERVAVVLSSGAEPAFADVIARAYGLTARERQVATLTLQGLSTREMALSLHVSSYTVQDHLKSIFDKVGVRSRRELAAQLFAQQYLPGFASAGDGAMGPGMGQGAVAERRVASAP